MDADGRVFCFNKKTDHITKPPPKHAGSRKGFNEFTIGNEPVSFEDRFQKIETRAAPVFRKMVQQNSLAAISAVEYQAAAEFVAIQGFRTDAFRQGLAEQHQENVGAIIEQLWESNFVTAQLIAQRRWLLMHIQHDDAFYLGDQPLALQCTEDPAKAQSLGIDMPGVEIFLPLTPEHALYMPCLSTTKEIVSGYENARLFDAHNRQLMAEGRPALNDIDPAVIGRILTNSKAFYESVTTGAPLVCVPENVQNFNYLQCMWAHQDVFSHRKDFSFALHVLNNTPQYRQTMPSGFETIGRIIKKA